MKKLSVKLVLFFISLMVISSIVSFLLSAFLPMNSIRNEMKLNQQVVAISILELNQKTDLDLEEIMNISTNFIYNVRQIKKDELSKLSETQLDKLNNQEILFLPYTSSHFGSTLLMVNNEYIRIDLHPHNNIFKVLTSRLWLTLLSYIVIGLILIVLLAKKAIKPILILTSATQEVAKGNFDIEITENYGSEFGLLTKNFNRMTRKLKNIEYLRKDFISNVSHEFKTPIGSIQGFATLLKDPNISIEERQEYADIIIEETTRLSQLSSNILKLSSLENLDTIENSTLFSLDEQIRKTILLLEPEWNEKGIHLDIDLEEVKFKGDEELLHLVWVNLLQNAIKFSSENSYISVKLYQTGSFIKVKIMDTGIGMTKETQDRIFEKFYQGDSAHSSDGNGLGLPIVKRILDLYGGTIYIKSELKKGSTFIVELQILTP